MPPDKFTLPRDVKSRGSEKTLHFGTRRGVGNL